MYCAIYTSLVCIKMHRTELNVLITYNYYYDCFIMNRNASNIIRYNIMFNVYEMSKSNKSKVNSNKGATCQIPYVYLRILYVLLTHRSLNH